MCVCVCVRVCVCVCVCDYVRVSDAKGLSIKDLICNFPAFSLCPFGFSRYTDATMPKAALSLNKLLDYSHHGHTQYSYLQPLL